jgi:hypothetical protein
MSIRRLAALAAIAAIGLLALGSASASATTTLRTDPTGAPLSGSTTIRNTTSDPAVLATQAGTITCNQTLFDADVTSNTSAGSISGSLTALTFTSCTDTILAINVSSCTLRSGTTPTVSITSAAGGGTVNLGSTTVRCATSLTQGCYYNAASANGTATNTPSAIRYSGVAVSAQIPAGLTDAVSVANCGTTGTFSVALTNIVQGTGTNGVTIATS